MAMGRDERARLDATGRPADRTRGPGRARLWRRAAALVLLAVAAPARADDWPQWLGLQRDGVWRETGILDKFPEGGPKVRWRAPVAAGYAGPAVAAGRVYLTDRVPAAGAKPHAEPFPQRPRQPIPGRERVLCLDAADGKPLWQHAYDCPYTISYPLGPRATPVVRAGLVYTLGAQGHLLCLRADTGAVVWGRDLAKDYGVKAPLWGFAAHPLLDGPRLVCMVGGEGSTVVAFDKDTGKELWRALSAKEPGYCPPVIYEAGGKRQLVVWDADNLSGLDPETGKVYWSEPAKTYQGMSIATPRREGNRLFVTAYPDTSVMLRLDPERPTATVAWRGDRKTGLNSVFSTPQFEGGHLYGVLSGGALCCVQADTGARLWTTGRPLGQRPAASAELFLVRQGGRYFLFTEKGDLIIARLSPRGYEEVSRAHLLDPSSAASGAFARDVLWSHPAFANRCAYVRNDKELLCVSLAAAAGDD
jgi:outer membrane protein assembly factor BamB